MSGLLVSVRNLEEALIALEAARDHRCQGTQPRRLLAR